MRFLKNREILLFVLISCASVTLCVLLFLQFPKGKIEKFLDSEQENLLIGGAFAFKNSDNSDFSSKNLEGDFTIMYFGMLSCKDTCSKVIDKMSDISLVLNKHNIKINLVFVTLDPLRDSMHLLNLKLSKINKNFTFFSPSNELSVKKLANLFKVFYFSCENSLVKDSVFAHSSHIYVLDKEARYVRHFFEDSCVSEISDFILSQTSS